MRTTYRLGLAILLAVACADSQTLAPNNTGADANAPALAASGVADGPAIKTVPHFFFLPPIGEDVAGDSDFDPDFLPYLTVEICAWDGTACVGTPIATFDASGAPASRRIRIGEPDDHY
ncbi:MAG: hypothetical protein R3344_13070, partial [Acidobacteriota bacterium]|nr:hypothetical protein [Acidobacteriota bacterium]